MFKRSILFVLSFLIFISCGKEEEQKEKEPLTPEEKRIELEWKTGFYLDLSEENLDKYGYPNEAECHGLMFCSLYAVGGGNCDPKKCENDKGQWFRTPSKDCFKTGKSGSTISRDMFLPLFHWVLQQEDSETIGDIIDFGRKHNKLGIWIMGEGDKSRVGFNPNLQGTVFKLRHHLGGNSHNLEDLKYWDKGLRGYKRHLQILHIYLRAKMDRSMSEKEFKIVREAAEENPRNGLYWAIYARFSGEEEHQTHAIDALLDTDIFPDDRLPDSSYRCEEYLFMREEYNKDGEINNDWLPCDEGKIFSAVDFLFASAIIRGVD